MSFCSDIKDTKAEAITARLFLVPRRAAIFPMKRQFQDRVAAQYHGCAVHVSPDVVDEQREHLHVAFGD